MVNNIRPIKFEDETAKRQKMKNLLCTTALWIALFCPAISTHAQTTGSGEPFASSTAANLAVEKRMDFAFQDIPTLGQFINVAAAQNFSHPRYSFIANRRCFLHAIFFSILKHTAEFENFIRLTELPYPHLRVKHRTARFNKDGYCNKWVQDQQ